MHRKLGNRPAQNPEVPVGAGKIARETGCEGFNRLEGKVDQNGSCYF